MATHDAVPHDADQPRPAVAGAPAVSGWRERRAARRRRRLVSARNRRKLARWLRAITADAQDRDPVVRHNSVLLHYRVCAARTEMLQIAAALQRVHDPDPAAMTLVHNLLSNRAGDSPLYNPHIPPGELDATLMRISAALESDIDSVDIEGWLA